MKRVHTRIQQGTNGQLLLLPLTFILLLMLQAACTRYPHTIKQVPDAPAQHAPINNYTDSTITLPVGSHYKRGTLHTFLYGKHYRPAWYTPVTFRVLDTTTIYLLNRHW